MRLQLQAAGSYGNRAHQTVRSAILPFHSYLPCGRIRSVPGTPLGGHVVNDEEQRRTAFVELEMAAVWQGHERGMVTRDEVHQRLEEL